MPRAAKKGKNVAVAKEIIAPDYDEQAIVDDSGNKLPWDDRLDLVFLKLVQHHGAHLPSITYDAANPKPVPENGKPVFHSKPADRFRDVTVAFFEDVNGGFPFRDKHFKLKDGKIDYRRFNDRYDKICKDVLEDIEVGNQSGKEGDLSEKYKLVQSMLREKDEAEAAKQVVKVKVKDLQNRLNKNVEEVLNGKKNNANKNTAIKVKMADGTIVIDEEKAAKKARSLDQTLDGKLFKFLDTMAMKGSAEDQRLEASEVALTQMQQFIMFQGHCLEAFLFEAFSLTSAKAPPDDLQGLVEDMGGLDMLVNLYCSRGDNFEPTKFKTLMGDFGIQPREARIMHVRLDKWRKDAKLFAAQQEDQVKNGNKRKKNTDEVSDITGATSTGASTASSPQLQQQQQQQQQGEEGQVADLGILADFVV